jgi:galactokinase
MKEIVAKKYVETFLNKPSYIVFSPGRINIIGEHTDYNEGFVLPAAMDKGVYIAIGKREDDTIHLIANDFNESFIGSINEVVIVKKLWANYILGVVSELQKDNKIVGGFNAVISSDLPIGAGVSSSAALECATVFALNELFHLQLQKMEMIKMAQMAEHHFAGVKCGIMDQFASMMGKKDHCIKLDCKTLQYEYVPLQLGEYKMLLLNTNVKHSLASSEYNTCRQECEQGVTWIKEKYTTVNSLRDVTLQMLDEIVLPKNGLVYKRCKFVVTEIERLQEACTALQNGDLNTLGKKMFATHYGLQNDYGVSCKELDFLVNAVTYNDFVLGARMMGGGFGGCTINIVLESYMEELIINLKEDYEKEMQLPLTTYIATIGDGTSLII